MTVLKENNALRVKEIFAFTTGGSQVMDKEGVGMEKQLNGMEVGRWRKMWNWLPKVQKLFGGGHSLCQQLIWFLAFNALMWFPSKYKIINVMGVVPNLTFS